MIITFKFSIFNLNIEHQILKELGEFTVFCMQAINENISLPNISNIIQLEEELIKKQLTFLISRKYLNSDYNLSQKGREIIELLQFINIFNQDEVKIALEQYVENDLKKIFSIDNSNFEKKQQGYLIKNNFFDYKLQTKFDEMIENDKNKIKFFLTDRFPNHKNIVDKHIDSFIFRILKINEEIFYNHSITEDAFIDMLEDSKLQNKNYITIEIPVVEIKKIVKSNILDKETVDSIQEKFDEYKYFNMINGKPISCLNKISNSTNLSIESKLKKNNIAKMQSLESISINNLLFVDLKTDIKDLKETKFFNITDIFRDI
ncbi:hypothetical protein [Desulfomicrobium baculatum]|uniref:Uncharacterized protein n=1 Tax=Desulfomicrobium baculatum (strain DSM 4028 / VKM B-1378 / X) TaxID=525897 RepID=C7LS10_DESBD|nr:hypothetical protein [Desulfomicrobium baculatum]ACU89393.1 hypothetical protein Dbac_1294 [Desulfomicrobium baculatum DSM 4028]